MEQEHTVLKEVLSSHDREGMNLPLTILVVVIFLVLGIGGAVFFVKTKSKPGKVEEVHLGTLVEIQPAEKKLHDLTLTAQGSVIAAKEIVIIPEATGRITQMHKRMVPGGLIKKGDRLFKINTQSTRISVAEQRTMLEQAKAMLEIEKGQQKVAKREWELFQKGKESTEDNALALRRPQLKNAKVAVDAAEARLSRARLLLSRTSFRAPFNAMVIQEAAEIGQLVSPNSRIATLVGTDAFWVQVSLPAENLPMINVPNAEGEGGSKVTVEQEIGSEIRKREGRVVRLLPNLDPAGRMAQLVVEIKDPLDLLAEKPNPLLLNSFVKVSIEGKGSENLIEVPRAWIRDGNSVYVYKDGFLEIKKVKIAWRKEKSVLIAGGLEDGDSIIISRVVAPINKMKLRLKQGETSTVKTEMKTEKKMDETTEKTASKESAKGKLKQ